jgi:Domain of unknown function (DUF4145)
MTIPAFGGDSVKCPHCALHFHEDWRDSFLTYQRDRFVPVKSDGLYWKYRVTACPACDDVTIEIGLSKDDCDGGEWSIQRAPIEVRFLPKSPRRFPAITSRRATCWTVSPKPSAALSRRCLQNMLHSRGYRARDLRDLSVEIDLLLNEPDPRKAIPHRLRETIDAIRNFGNFSAHPIDDKTALQVIDVEPHEAEWCLEILEECFQHFYVGPAVAKARKIALDEKLALAGKPPSKS